MTFATLNATVVELRNSLRSFVGEDAIAEITIAPPARQEDETSFLKLVSWSYVLVFEAGRVSIRYLLQLPSEREVSRAELNDARDLVHDLRTWSFHNVGFLSDQGRAVSKRVRRWFIETSGTCPPNNSDGWSSCFLALCSQVQTMMDHCQGAITTVLVGPDDGVAATADLRQRIDRAWPAYEFHSLVEDAAIRLSINLDAKRFCEGRLTAWRKHLECLPDSADTRGDVLRLIERDLLAYTEDLLPIDARDIMSALRLEPGPEVGCALRQARSLFRAGIRDPRAILTTLADQHRDGS